MAEFKLTVIPAGKLESDELEAVLTRVTRVVRHPMELRGSLPVPQGIEDSDRRQFRTSVLMDRLRAMVPQLGPGKLFGPGGAEEEKPGLRTDGYIFVTDVDLFTARTDGVFAALISNKKLAVVSVRRLREAFYRRKADPVKQRTRQVKEVCRMAARLQGAPQCVDPKCILSPSKMLMDVDLKEEKLCRSCTTRLFEGRIEI
jgi:predicted Zn-dependent protease